jgi:uncharacterized protein (DUF2344 family)
MSNPVNDYDLKNNFPAVGRKIYLLTYMIEVAQKRISEYRTQQLRIINNALENKYSLEEVDKKKGSWVMMKGDEKWVEEQIEKMGL